MPLSLNEIGLSHGTDKASNGHNYLKYYEQHFASMRYKPVSLLEIGIWEGGSLKMWEEYFPDGKIFGIDIDEKIQYDSTRIKTLVADQGDSNQLRAILGDDTDLDIVIDDGSHEGLHQLISFNTIFPILKPGALYCIEDLLCTYDSRWNDPINFRDRLKQMIEEVNMSGNISNDHICANKEEAVTKYGGSYWDKHIEWIFVSCGLVIIKKM